MPVEPGSATAGLTASLHPPVLDVEPGGSASTELRVACGGHATTDLRFEVLGGAATWSFVVPPVPGTGPAGVVSARVVVRPPRTALPPAGPSALAVRVWVDGVDGHVGAQARAEGSVTIAPFTDIAASLVPRVGEGRSASQHELQVTNRGNASSTVTFGVTQGASLSVHLHDRTLVVPAGGATTTKVAVHPDNRLMRGPAQAHPFRLEVTPEHGAAVSAMGEMHQQPLLGARSAVALAAVVLLGLIAVVAGSRAMSSSPKDAGKSTAAASNCPAAGHQDTFVSGLTPGRIPTLPSGFSFSATRDDGCSPVRFDPCQPVHYVVNPARAPAAGVADVEEAFNRLARVTGMTFTNDGMTDEVDRRGPYVPDRYPDRWAPILIVWTHQSGGRANIEVVGSGFPNRVQDVLVSGTLTLNSDAIVNRARNTPVPSGFGSGGGRGIGAIGAIGAEGVTWGRVILHELAHIVGLGHTRDRDQLMYPDTAEQTSHTTDYRSGDRKGLRWLGRDSGCLPATPTPD